MERSIDYSAKCFEAILTYAIDEISDGSDFNILNDIGFNEKVFYKDNIYHERANKETEIIKSLRKSQKPIRIIGHPGTGKTTILNKVFCRLKDDKNDNAYILYIDFKNHGEINREENSIYSNMDTFIKRLLTSNVESYLHDRNITNSEIAQFIILDNEYLKSGEVNNPQFTKFVSELRTIWDIETLKESSFNDWFLKMRKERIGYFKEKFIELSNSIQIHNILYFLSRNGGNENRLCIVCFDNVDSIIDNSVRNTFINFFRNYSSNDKLSAKYIYSIRSDNYKTMQLSDAKTYLEDDITVDYDDFVDEEMYQRKIDIIVKEEGFCDTQRRQNIKRKLIRNGRASFAKSILNKRLEYLSKVNIEETREIIENENPVSTIKENNFDHIIRICHLLHDDEYLRLAFIELCNNDRREMLVNMFKFINYLFEEVNIDLKSLEAFKEETEFILESYFYGWIASEKQFYHHGVYNIPKAVIDWYDQKYVNHIQCVTDHQIFATLYNLCNYSLHQYSYMNHTKVGDLLDRLELIGYNRDNVKQRIFELYREPGVEETRGLIEISRWFQITKPEHLADNDDISLTPRSFYLTSFANLKFINVIARLRACKVNVQGKLFTFDDRIPINPSTLYTNLYFLGRLATMTLNGLYDIKTHLENKFDNWFVNYRKLFCVKTNGDKIWKDELGDLLVNNMFVSHLKFLRRQRKIDNEIKIHEITTEVINEYEKLFLSFNTKVTEFIDNETKYNDYDFVLEIEKNTFFKKTESNPEYNNM